MTTPIIDRADLHCQEGSKDAVYHIEIVQEGDGHLVNYRNGRRGGTLAHGTKTPNGPVDLASARKLFDKVVRDKLRSHPPYKHMTSASTAIASIEGDFRERATGLSPQLLNELDAFDHVRIASLIADPRQAMQQKIDGERRMVRGFADGRTPIGSNRKALQVPLPQPIASSVAGVPCVLDAEIVDEHLFVFDLLELDGQDLRLLPLRTRLTLLDKARLRFGQGITVLPTAYTAMAKQTMLHQTRAAGQEGVVFKDLDSVSAEGRPNSGGPHLKLKHWAEATVIVLGAKQDKKSVLIGLHATDEAADAGSIVNVGAVTIPSGIAMPEPGTLADVRYLYAFPNGGSLFQPTWRRVRTDLDRAAASMNQLKLKAQHRVIQLVDERPMEALPQA